MQRAGASATRAAPPALIDSHCHLDFPVFDADRAAVLRRAAARGVGRCVVAGTTAARWPRLLAVCAAHPQLHPALGLHPWFMDAHGADALAQLERALDAPGVVALGECGLDYQDGRENAAAQQALFHAQLDLARTRDLPVIIHARKAVEDVLAALRARPGLRGMVHAWSGSAEQARQLVALGFHLGIGGPVTWPRARRVQGVAATVPLGALLLETDSPDQPLAGRRGERNEPARLAEVLAAVAALRPEPAAEIAAQTTRNARRLFALPDD